MGSPNPVLPPFNSATDVSRIELPKSFKIIKSHQHIDFGRIKEARNNKESEKALTKKNDLDEFE